LNNNKVSTAVPELTIHMADPTQMQGFGSELVKSGYMCILHVS